MSDGRLLHANLGPVVDDVTGQPVPTTMGRLTVDPVEVDWPFSERAGARMSFEFTEGVTARPGWGGWLDITAPGYEPQRIRGVVPDGDGELCAEDGTPIVVRLKPLVQQPPFVDIRKWRGNFLGDFVTPPFMYAGMPDMLRTQVRSTYPGTHLPVAAHNDYRLFPQWHYDLWDNVDPLRVHLAVLKSAGIEPILVLHPKPGWSINQHLTRVRRLWPLVTDLIRFVQWGWEINDLGGEWGNGDSQLRYLAGLQKIVGPTPIGVHFTSERWSGWPSYDHSDDSKSEYDWLKEAKKLSVTTLLYQEPPDKPEDEVIKRSFVLANPDIPELGGIADRVVWRGLDFVLFEHSRDVARHDRLAKRAMQFPTCAGYC